MDAARLQDSFGRVAAAGDEVPLYFYSHLFLTHPEIPGHVPGEHGRPARPARRRAAARSWATCTRSRRSSPSSSSWGATTASTA